jgi:hypothetical protein
VITLNQNILAGYLRRGSLIFAQACVLQHEAEALLNGAEHEPDSKRVLELVRARECSAYDCEFIAVAEDLGITEVLAKSTFQAEFRIAAGEK